MIDKIQEYIKRSNFTDNEQEAFLMFGLILSLVFIMLLGITIGRSIAVFF